MDSYNWQHLWYSSLSQTQTERADPRESQPHKGTSPPNPTTGGSRLFFSVPFSYFLFIFYLPRCTLPDFPSFSSLASLLLLSYCHHDNNNNNRVTRTSIAHWIKIHLRRTSEHNHKYNYLNF